MDQLDVFDFVFEGAVDRARWDEADRDERLRLVEQYSGAEASDGHRHGGVMLLARYAVVEQLLTVRGSAEPLATARRLVDAGLGRDQILAQLMMAFTLTAQAVVDEEADDADELYVEMLGQLPVPGHDDVMGAVEDVTSTEQVLTRDELVARIGERVGVAGSPLMGPLVDAALQELAEADGPLLALNGWRVAHVPSLTEGVVLTHELSEAEQLVGALTVSTDLAGFNRVALPVFDGAELDVIAGEPGHVAWSGPDGWLDRFAAGDVLAVRVDSHDGDDAVQIEVLDACPPIDDKLVSTLRNVYDEAVRSELPAWCEDLVVGLLAESPSLFSQPAAPLDMLCEAAGLERRGSMVADTPELWANGRLALHAADLGDQDDETSQGCLAVLDVAAKLAEGVDVGDGRLRDTLNLLRSPDILELVCDQYFTDGRAEVEARDLAAALLDVAHSSPQRSTARYMAALAAELDSDVEAAEQHLELAVEADAGNLAAVDRLAWYASDRGDAPKAARLWRRCRHSVLVDEDLAMVEPFAKPAASRLGRNDPCWCGSGRKYKQCHIGAVEQAPLPDRVGWLCRKAVGYLMHNRGTTGEDVASVVLARSPSQDDYEVGVTDPLTLDLVLTEGGWFRRFLSERGPLLPDDEAQLAASWLTVERTVYEVVSVRRGRGLRLRDLRTGDEVEVREQTLSTDAKPGQLLCGRAVPDGETNQLVGGVFRVPPGYETTLLELLDEGDPWTIAAWVCALEQPPALRNREGEDTVLCEIVVRADDRDALLGHLDEVYSADEDAPGERWAELHSIDEDELLIRATLALDGDTLTISTNSQARADRILGRLHEAVAVTVVAGERTPLDMAELWRRQGGQGDPPPASSLAGQIGLAPDHPDEAPQMPPEAVAQIQDKLERRWCDESIPALGGLTPRQAAVDPTRREQLERLLDSFDEVSTPPGAVTMRVGRLREMLGL